MKPSKTESSFLLGLSAYANQMQLSIDRNEWEDFCNFVIAGKSLDRILEVAQINLNIDISSINLAPTLVKPKINCISSFFNRSKLTQQESEFIYSILYGLSIAIKKKEMSQNQRIDLRMSLLDVSDVVDRVLGDNDSNLVDHLNQSDLRKTKSIDEIVGYDWP